MGAVRPGDLRALVVAQIIVEAGVALHRRLNR
jgi:hypothetical protein